MVDEIDEAARAIADGLADVRTPTAGLALALDPPWPCAARGRPARNAHTLWGVAWTGGGAKRRARPNHPPGGGGAGLPAGVARHLRRGRARARPLRRRGQRGRGPRRRHRSAGGSRQPRNSAGVRRGDGAAPRLGQRRRAGGLAGEHRPRGLRTGRRRRRLPRKVPGPPRLLLGAHGEKCPCADSLWVRVLLGAHVTAAGARIASAGRLVLGAARRHGRG